MSYYVDLRYHRNSATYEFYMSSTQLILPSNLALNMMNNWRGSKRYLIP